MAVNSTQLRGVAQAIGRDADAGRVTAPSGIVARVLNNPGLPASRADAVWQLPESGHLFGATGLPTKFDIDKGTVGDCWFVAHAGARALADPVGLKAMFEETTRHYIVHFPGDSVAVTKDLPFHDGVPAFAAHDWKPGSGNGLWMAVLEKAAAAREPGGYQSLVGGQAARGFEMTMGAHPTKVEGSTPFRDALEGLRAGLPTAIGVTPYESVPRPGLPTIHMSIGQKQVLDSVGMWGNHYWIGERIGELAGHPTIEMWSSNLTRQPVRGLTEAEFNAVVTDVDTPWYVGDYMRSGINQQAQRALGLDARTPAFPKPATQAEQAVAAVRDRDGHTTDGAASARL